MSDLFTTLKLFILYLLLITKFFGMELVFKSGHSYWGTIIERHGISALGSLSSQVRRNILSESLASSDSNHRSNYQHILVHPLSNY